MSTPTNYDDFVRLEFDGNQTTVVKSCECIQMPNKVCIHNRNWKSSPRKRSSGDDARRTSEQYHSVYSNLKQRSDSEESIASNIISFLFVSSTIEQSEDVLTIILPTGGIATCPFGLETTFADVKNHLWKEELFPYNSKHEECSAYFEKHRNSLPCSPEKVTSPKARNKRSRSLSVLDTLKNDSIHRTDNERTKLCGFKSRKQSDYIFISPLSGRVGNFIPDNYLVTQINLLDNVVKLIEVGQSRREEVLEQSISIVIDKPISMLDCITSEEVTNYRIAMHNCMYKTVLERENCSTDDRIAYEYPTEMDDSDKMELSSFYFKSYNNPISRYSTSLPTGEPAPSDEAYADVLVGAHSKDNKELDEHSIEECKDYDKAVVKSRKLSIPDYIDEVEEVLTSCRCEGNRHWSWKRLRNVRNKCSKCSTGRSSEDIIQVSNQEYADHYEISLNNSHSYSFVRDSNDDDDNTFKPKSARITVWLTFEVVFNTIFGKTFTKNLPSDIVSFLNDIASLKESAAKRTDSLLKKKSIKDDSSDKEEDDNEDVQEQSNQLNRSQSVKKRFSKLFQRKLMINKKPDEYCDDGWDDNTEPISRTIPIEIKTRIDNVTPMEFIQKILRFFLKLLKTRIMTRLEDRQMEEVLDYTLSLKNTFSKDDSELESSLAFIEDKDPALAKFLKIMQNFRISADRFLLQICGYEQYLIANVSLLTYEYVRDVVSKQLLPQLLLVSKSDIIDSLTTYDYITPLFIQKYSNNNVLEQRFFSKNFQFIMEQIRTQENAFLSRILSNAIDEDYTTLLEENYNSFIKLIENCDEQLSGNILTNIETKEPQPDKQAKPSNDNETNYATICQQSTKKANNQIEEINYRSFIENLKSHKSSDNNCLEVNDYFEKNYQNQDVCSSWNMGTILRFKVILANYINIAGVDQVYVQAGVYHGDNLISERLSTRLTDPLNPKWQQLLEFQHMLVSDIPLSAKLCLCIVAFSQKGRSDASYCPVSYANLPFFDHKRRMLSNRITIQMWPINVFEDVSEERNFLKPSGELGCNPDRVGAPRLQIEFENFSNMIIFPLSSEINRYAECNLKSRKVQAVATKRLSKEREIVLQELLTHLDPFWKLTQSQKMFIWEQRYHLRRTTPDSLPMLVQSVRWYHREEACEFYVILEAWPIIAIDAAFVLLQINYSDQIVKEFAVKSLDAKLTDGLMMHYMLQFIQLLRKEPYHDTPLARFLLKRALSSRKLGQMMFWTLKSQLSDPSVCIRFTIILEMYCRGLSDKALKEAVRQLNAFEKFAMVLQETESETNNRKEKIISKLQVEPNQKLINNLYSPLNITLPLDEVIFKRCRLMDSAKKPLWLEWKNNTILAWANRVQKNAIIFKTGDDLRQDMLTLQLIRVMDYIWRCYGLDMRMLPYDCLCTGQMVGMIQVVLHAKTVMSIQREGGWLAAHQVDNSKVYKWLKKKNPNSFETAIDTFTRSCAGYCVATFILGIGDRNPDNIMLNEHGQLFHIDFGHFLGHFKSKLGIKRERVPFVLTRDFIHVITRGSSNPLKSPEFKNFQALCIRAYLALYDNSHILVRLFWQMMNTGIPELNTFKDIDYLRASLQVKRKRREAINFFAAGFEEALAGTWSTKVDWLFHNIKHK